MFLSIHSTDNKSAKIYFTLALIFVYSRMKSSVVNADIATKWRGYHTSCSLSLRNHK